MPVALLLAHGGSPYDGPPVLTPARIFTEWVLDPWLVAALVLIAALYLAGVARLRRRGVAWSGWRTASFVVGGLGVIAVATNASLGAYDDTLFSMHMAQHMVLSMVAPIFLALGAPITLVLRAVAGRPRTALVAALHSWPVKVASSPLVGFPLMVGTPFALYFTSLYQKSLEHPWLHELLHVHFVLVGCLFFWPILGLDPLPGRLPYPLRMIAVFLALPFHAFLGVAIMGANHVLAGPYYRALDLPWHVDLLHDQNVGGGILWGSGDLVQILILAALAVQWMRADEREAVREDRRLDRLERQAAREAELAELGALGVTSGPRRESAAEREAREDAELAAYNAALAALAARTQRG